MILFTNNMTLIFWPPSLLLYGTGILKVISCSVLYSWSLLKSQTYQLCGWETFRETRIEEKEVNEREEKKNLCQVNSTSPQDQIGKKSSGKLLLPRRKPCWFYTHTDPAPEFSLKETKDQKSLWRFATDCHVISSLERSLWKQACF